MVAADDGDGEYESVSSSCMYGVRHLNRMHASRLDDLLAAKRLLFSTGDIVLGDEDPLAR
jgi:hypothetical protein